MMENEKEISNIAMNNMFDEIVEEVTKINGQKVFKKYVKQGFLGKGGFAECYLTYNKQANRRLATKIIPKRLLESPRTKLRLANQIRLHKSLHHENIVEFYTNFEDENNVYINLQLCQNGSINDLLQCRYQLTTPEIQSFLYGLCQGILYLHSRNIIHRDIKLGNLFLDAKNRVKIGDFGLASKLEFPNQRKRTVCGTPNYIAPEILFGKGYHFQVDIWAIGIVLYSLFFTIPPFETDQAITTYQKIKKCQYSFPNIHRAPTEAIDLIKKILVSNPHQRLTIVDILDHPFMKLGNGILSHLPNIIIKRAPIKKELASIPIICRKNSSLPRGNSQAFGMILQRKSSQKQIYNQISKLQQSQISSIVEKSENSQDVCCIFFEELQEKLFFFCLNNGNLGIMDAKNSQIFTRNLKDSGEKVQNKQIRRISTDQKQKTNDIVSFEQCPHRLLLCFKEKQIRKYKLQLTQKINQGINIVRMSQYKEMIMIKFSNKMLQLLFQQKDGFLFHSITHKLCYYPNCSQPSTCFNIQLEDLVNFQSKKQNGNKNLISPENIIRGGKLRKQKSVLTWKKLNYAAKIFEQAIMRPVRKV